jgi:hypothetical protein
MPPHRFSPGISFVAGVSRKNSSLQHSGKLGQVKNKTEHLIRARAFKIFVLKFSIYHRSM